MKTNKTFESWYTMIMEGELATATSTEAPTISNDIDTIMSSLETLAKELTEELAGEEFSELNEADAEAPGIVMQWMWWMPKARKAQQKVNKIKLNVTDMESAAEDAPDPQQKAKITAKAKIAKEQAAELQKMVDDKFKSKGNLVQKAISNEKIAGQIASIKRASGLEDDPAKSASYKEKMAELQQKYKEDQEAIKELEPSEDDKKEAKAKKDQEAKDAKEKQDKLDADAKAAKDAEAGKNTPEETEDTEETPEETPEEKTAREEKEASDAKAKQLSDLKTELTTAEEEGDEEKIEAIKAKIEQIEAKESWQLDGTHLGKMYEMEINKIKYDRILNESKYENLSVKERFSRLM